MWSRLSVNLVVLVAQDEPTIDRRSRMMFSNMPSSNNQNQEM